MDFITKRKLKRGRVEGTGSQSLCWLFQLPHGLCAIGGGGGGNRRNAPIDEQEKVLAVLFDSSDCYHIALLAANCNCQLKQWRKL